MATPPDLATLQAQLKQALQDAEDAEHARDTAKLARMKVSGQLSTLQKALAAVAPDASSDKDPQVAALARIEWLAIHGKPDPAAAAAAKAAEMEAPMPSRAVLEAVIAGTRKFTKEQLEFSVGETMVLTGWQMTPVELIEKGEKWLAQQVLKNSGDD